MIQKKKKTNLAVREIQAGYGGKTHKNAQLDQNNKMRQCLENVHVQVRESNQKHSYSMGRKENKK